MRSLVDAQLPPALAHWLGDKGYAASSVRDAGFLRSDDGSIRNYAREGGWVLVTKDEDFAEEEMNFHAGPPVVWLRIGNATNRVLFAWLEPILPEIIRQLESGQSLVEVRKE
jgi:predicted nuclease of predicted toxin-antitoxin system